MKIYMAYRYDAPLRTVATQPRKPLQKYLLSLQALLVDPLWLRQERAAACVK